MRKDEADAFCTIPLRPKAQEPQSKMVHLYLCVWARFFLCGMPGQYDTVRWITDASEHGASNSASLPGPRTKRHTLTFSVLFGLLFRTSAPAPCLRALILRHDGHT